MTKVQAVILAAGKGTRMGSDEPKILLNVGGKTIAERILKLLSSIDIDDPIFVVGYGKEQVIDFVRPINPKARFATQKVLSGTATAVATALPLLDADSPTFVLMGDHPFYQPKTLQNLLELHQREGAVFSMITHVMADPRGFGHILRDGSGNVMGMKETKGLTLAPGAAEVNTGCYVIDTQWAKMVIPKIKPAAGSGEYHFPELAAIAYEEGKKVSALLVDDYSEVMGLNTPEHLNIARSK